MAEMETICNAMIPLTCSRSAVDRLSFLLFGTTATLTGFSERPPAASLVTIAYVCADGLKDVPRALLDGGCLLLLLSLLGGADGREDV